LEPIESFVEAEILPDESLSQTLAIS